MPRARGLLRSGQAFCCPPIAPVPRGQPMEPFAHPSTRLPVDPLADKQHDDANGDGEK